MGEVVNETMGEIGGVFIVIALICLFFGMRSRKKRKKIIDWPETEGKVIEYLGSHIEEYYDTDTKYTERRPTHEFKVSYTVNGNVIEYIKTNDYVKGNNVDDIIRIKYDPSNPEIRHEDYNAQSSWTKGIPQFAIAAALTVCGIVFFCLAYIEF